MFPQIIKDLRLSKKMTQKEVAEKLEISRPAYTAYETGKRQPDYKTLQKIARLFNVSTDYLLGVKHKDHEQPESKVRTLAAHIDENVTDEDMREIINFIDYVRKRDNKE